MTGYIKRAKEHLEGLAKSIDSEIFKKQYESLNHNQEKVQTNNNELKKYVEDKLKILKLSLDEEYSYLGDISDVADAYDMGFENGEVKGGL